MPTTLISRITDTTVAAAASLLRVRWFVRVPVHLYRAGLGFLFGSRLLMLEHIGRKSGARRYVVLEVVGHPAAGSYVVASGFAAQAQWFRNIRANPHVRIYLGDRRPRPATARILTPEQGAAALAAYSTAHPRAWRRLRPVFENTLGARIDEQATTLPLVSLDIPADPIGLPTDDALQRGPGTA